MKDELIEDPVKWGRQLILSEDHDPLYSSLVRWEVNGARRRRFLLAYWCCYSVGASWWISQHSGSRFWDWLLKAAINEEEAPIGGRWPRAHERRHWRGAKCVKCVWTLAARFRHPEEAVLSLEGYRSPLSIEKAMRDWPQFGPWIAFKAADMLERVLGVPIKFSNDIVTLYDDPRKGAEMMAPYLGLDTPQEVAEYLLEEYGGLIAPGYKKDAARLCNIQEVETVLCKWKSARGGHYWLGCDTQAHRKELMTWNGHDLLAVYPSPAA